MKRYVIVSKKVFLAVLSVAVAIIFAVVILLAGHPNLQVSSSQKLLPIYCTKQDEKIVSISFDAAWGADDTDNIIEILNKYGIKATFFLVGDWADKYPDEVKKLSEAGHEVMNHSSTHPYFTKLTREKMVEELETCNGKIEKLTGQKPFLFRPPYGDYNNSVIEAVQSLGMFAIQWDVDSLDWKGISAEEITKRVTEKVQPGSIVLFHNAAEHTPEALPTIIEKLQSDGYKFVKISEQILTDNYSIDNNGRQFSN